MEILVISAVSPFSTMPLREIEVVNNLSDCPDWYKQAIADWPAEIIKCEDDEEETSSDLKTSKSKMSEKSLSAFNRKMAFYEKNKTREKAKIATSNLRKRKHEDKNPLKLINGEKVRKKNFSTPVAIALQKKANRNT